MKKQESLEEMAAREKRFLAAKAVATDQSLPRERRQAATREMWKECLGTPSPERLKQEDGDNGRM